MRIGELSRRTGASQRALRHYETEKLLQPKRLPSGYREYTEEDVRAVRRIRVLLDAGLNIAQIAQVLPCLADVGEDRLAPVCSQLKAELAKTHDRLGEAISRLETTRGNLATLITAEAPAAASGPPGTDHMVI